MTIPDTGDPSCAFCRRPGPEVILSDGIWYARFDRHPVTPGHLLVIPFRHCSEFSALNAE